MRTTRLELVASPILIAALIIGFLTACSRGILSPEVADDIEGRVASGLGNDCHASFSQEECDEMYDILTAVAQYHKTSGDENCRWMAMAMMERIEQENVFKGAPPGADCEDIYGAANLNTGEIWLCPHLFPEGGQLQKTMFHEEAHTSWLIDDEQEHLGLTAEGWAQHCYVPLQQQ